VILRRKGLQPVTLFVEANVKVSVRVRITCFRVFRKRICIYITFSFHTRLRFEYTLGGGSGSASSLSLAKAATLDIPIQIGRIPVIYTPAFTRGKAHETAAQDSLFLVHQFALPFFAKKKENDVFTFSEDNIFRNDIIKVLFGDLVKGLKAGGYAASYHNLRTVLMTGALETPSRTVPVQLSFPDYRPLFITGRDMETDSKVLTTIFRFTEHEAKEFIDSSNNACESVNNATCPFLLVPIPVTQRISVQAKEYDNGKLTDLEGGFSIQVSRLVKDAKGGETPSLQIGEISYTQSEVDVLEKYSDTFKTQFVDRSKLELFSTMDAAVDLRKDFLVPEFFKLAGLLVLEAYANAHEQDQRDRLYQGTKEVTVEALLADTGLDWKLNEKLADIIGQLNYYYSHGLRLPGRDGKGLAFYGIMDQLTAIAGVSNALDDSAKVELLVRKDATTTVAIDLTDEIFHPDHRASEVAAFKKAITNLVPELLEELQQGITYLGVKQPYQAVYMTLPVHNSILETTDGSVRFLGIPDKLSTEAGHDQYAGSYASRLVVSEFESRETRELHPIPCAHVEVKVRPVYKDGKVTMLEFVNVFVDDLDLINIVRRQSASFSRITLYHKGADDKKVPITTLYKAQAYIIKTNLSPKTHPPVILPSGLQALKQLPDRYMASIADMPAFTHLAWEGMTTNHGGYYLLLDVDVAAEFPKPEPGKPAPEHTVILSFEASMEAYPGFCNYLKQTDEDGLFKKLDDKSHHTYLEQLRKDNVQIMEYHPAIPAHCFSFEVRRKLLPDLLSQYLPVEFGIKGSKEITRERMLPLLPQENPDKSLEGEPLWYRHVNPVNTLSSIEGKERYSQVGKQLQVNFGVRDIYGLQAITLNRSLDYTHTYSDKLVPLGAWPFVNFSLVYNGFNTNTKMTTWKIEARFHKVKDATQILGSEQDKARIQELLYTAMAQVRDTKLDDGKVNYRIYLDYGKQPIPTETLVKVLQDCMGLVNGKEPGGPQEICSFELAETPFDDNGKQTPLKTAIQASIVFEREEALCCRIVPEKDTIIWGAGDRQRLVNEIGLQTTQIRDLDEKIRKDSPYRLGVGSDMKKNRVYFLVNENYFEPVNTAIRTIERKAYFGITPYSNKLWSGSYTYAGNNQQFTDVDLDRGLRTVLNHMDVLLDPAHIAGLGASDHHVLEQLVGLKKKLVVEELMRRTDHVDMHVNDVSQATLQRELRYLLLEKLGNFYAFDGIIRQPIALTNPLKHHRLSLSIANVPNYNFVPSKIDFVKEAPEWVVLFDQVTTGNITIQSKPSITHIEYDIKATDSPEIESSSWIQLVTPYELAPLDIKNWPPITREFPPKPVILKQEALQSTADLPSVRPQWSTDLGKWKYQIDLLEQYVEGDWVEIVLNLKEISIAGGLAQRNFEGFIAYWSHQVSLPGNNLDWKAFVTDLAYQLSLPAKLVSLPSEREDAPPRNIFFLKLIQGAWKVEIPNDSGLNGYKINLDVVNFRVTVEGFNVLMEKGARIVSVKPELRTMRNYQLRNPAFQYATEVVVAEDWVTPFIRYQHPIDNPGALQAVFDKLPHQQLPYKATAKFLRKGPAGARVGTVPVRQMEFKKGKPVQIDDAFAAYKNGSSALSLTLYNTERDSNLPIFHAETIQKI
jgi:hypothetical protein